MIFYKDDMLPHLLRLRITKFRESRYVHGMYIIAIVREGELWLSRAGSTDSSSLNEGEEEEDEMTSAIIRSRKINKKVQIDVMMFLV